MTPNDSTTRVTGSDGRTIFADNHVAAQLDGQVDPLSRPSEHQWQHVKQNASRTVHRGRAGQLDIFVKHFHSHSLLHRLAGRIGRSDAQVEFEAMEHLLARGVRTLRPLAACWTGPNQWVATEALEPSQDLATWHEDQLDRGDQGRRQIRLATRLLGKLIGRMHACGVLHNDLHCGNVLIDQAADRLELVLTDLHRTSRRRRLSRRSRAMNLAQLLHDRFEFSSRNDRLRFLKSYLRASGAGGSIRGWQRLIEHLSARHRRRQHAKRDRRAMGNNRYFHRMQIGPWKGHVILASKRKLAGSLAAHQKFTLPQWQEALGDIDSLTSGPDVEVVKQSGSGIVVRRRLTIGGVEVDVFIKRPRRKRRWKVLLDCLRTSRTLRAFQLGHALLTRRISTALPLAAFEIRRGPCLKDSILITEAVEAPNMQEFFETWLSKTPKGDTPLTVGQQRHLAQEVLARLGRMLQILHDNSFAHRDLKASNILVLWSPGQRPEVVLIDMDGLKHVWLITTRRKYQGLMRLNVSLLLCDSVNHAGRLRMLLGYLRRPGCGRIDFKPSWRVLELWSARKIRQQIRSRRKKQRAQRRPSN
ncbi:MAG: lipopolysaccharide kinase InaA family protein [Phycisphaerae bacterium]